MIVLALRAGGLLALFGASSPLPTPTMPRLREHPVAAVDTTRRRAVGAARDPVQGLLPKVPRVRGPLALRVVYPVAGSAVDADDSTFVFGNAGSGDALVQVAGQSVPVADNGAWLGWVRLPSGAEFELEVVARRGTDLQRTVVPLRRARAFVAPATGVWVDTTSFGPRGRAWLPAGDPVALRVRATPGAQVAVRLPDGVRLPLAPAGGAARAADGILAFDRDTLRRRPARDEALFVGALPAQPLCGAGRAVTVLDPLPESSAADCAVLEVVLAGDTVRTPWPLALATLDGAPLPVELDDDRARRGGTDSLTIGRALRGGTYHWFFPTGTRALARARINEDVELQLSAGSRAWVPAGDVQALPAGTPAPRAVIGSVSATPLADRIVLRIPWSEPVPVQVEAGVRGLEVVLYSAVGDLDWLRYGGTDPFLARISWRQRTHDEVALTLETGGPLWGWRVRTTAGDLVLELRRPPLLDARHPLKDLRIVVDPGHPPLGATGPTGYREAEANLAVAQALTPMLRARGADVRLTRSADIDVPLGDRVPFAERVDAHLLLSIHNNALPDGVEPLANSGTSVFYNQTPSLPLAMAVQRALVAQLGVRDLGVARGDLALVRGTWVPSILTEGLFMMVPAHEAALRSEAGRRRYAAGVVAGAERFLRDLAGPARRP